MYVFMWLRVSTCELHRKDHTHAQAVCSQHTPANAGNAGTNGAPDVRSQLCARRLRTNIMSQLQHHCLMRFRLLPS